MYPPYTPPENNALCVNLSKVKKISLEMNEIIHELFQTESRPKRDYVEAPVLEGVFNQHELWNP